MSSFNFNATVLSLFLVVMTAILGAVNYYLWLLQEDKKQSISDLQQQVETQTEENRLLAERNQYKSDEVNILRSPDAFYIYEEKLRQDYGMVGKNETFFVLNEAAYSDVQDVAGLSAFERNANSPSVAVRESEQYLREEAQRQAEDLRNIPESNEAPPPPAPVLELESMQ
ncbi:MAG: septum formation initiator family protein [Cardiobacteriaceae bacterium]|nr:septum formation initiator family protein [Cardiobacteriaceae bacterium]